MPPCSDKLLELSLCQFKMALCWLMHTQLGIVQEMWVFCWSVSTLVIGLDLLLHTSPFPSSHGVLVLCPVVFVVLCFQTAVLAGVGWGWGGEGVVSFPSPLRFCPVCFLLESFRPSGDSLREPPFPLSTELVC